MGSLAGIRYFIGTALASAAPATVVILRNCRQDHQPGTSHEVSTGL
jgi:hypothetical protein